MDGIERLKDLAISESGFVFDPATGHTFSVNATGRVLLQGLREAYGRDALVKLLHEQFEVAEEDLRRDIDDFVGVLRRQEILATDFLLDRDGRVSEADMTHDGSTR
jgi:hypothetical protein